MRRRLIPLVAIIGASACLGGSTEPAAGADITGVYHLQYLGNCIIGVYGCVVDPGSIVSIAVMGASIALDNDLSFTVTEELQRRTSLETVDTTAFIYGTYTRSGATVTMTDTQTTSATHGYAIVGKLTLDAIRIENSGAEWLYRK